MANWRIVGSPSDARNRLAIIEPSRLKVSIGRNRHSMAQTPGGTYQSEFWFFELFIRLRMLFDASSHPKIATEELEVKLHSPQWLAHRAGSTGDPPLGTRTREFYAARSLISIRRLRPSAGPVARRNRRVAFATHRTRVLGKFLGNKNQFLWLASAAAPAVPSSGTFPRCWKFWANTGGMAPLNPRLISGTAPPWGVGGIA